MTIRHLPIHLSMDDMTGEIAEGLAALDGAIEGVVAASDAIAMDTIRQLVSKGIRVPDDIAVTGFDDLPLARHTVPQLTTVKQDIVQGAHEMVARLMARLGGESLPRHRFGLLPPTGGQEQTGPLREEVRIPRQERRRLLDRANDVQRTPALEGHPRLDEPSIGVAAPRHRRVGLVGGAPGMGDGGGGRDGPDREEQRHDQHCIPFTGRVAGAGRPRGRRPEHHPPTRLACERPRRHSSR